MGGSQARADNSNTDPEPETLEEDSEDGTGQETGDSEVEGEGSNIARRVVGRRGRRHKEGGGWNR